MGPPPCSGGGQVRGVRHPREQHPRPEARLPFTGPHVLSRFTRELLPALAGPVTTTLAPERSLCPRLASRRWEPSSTSRARTSLFAVRGRRQAGGGGAISKVSGGLKCQPHHPQRQTYPAPTHPLPNYHPLRSQCRPPRGPAPGEEGERSQVLSQFELQLDLHDETGLTGLELSLKNAWMALQRWVGS